MGDDSAKKQIEESFVDAQMRALDLMKTKRAEVSVSGASVKLRVFVEQSHVKRAFRFTIKFPSPHAAGTFAQEVGKKYPAKVEPDPQKSLFE